jgi:hypothetical protein
MSRTARSTQWSVNRDNVISFQGPIEYKSFCANNKVTGDGPFIGSAAGGEAVRGRRSEPTADRLA